MKTTLKLLPANTEYKSDNLSGDDIVMKLKPSKPGSLFTQPEIQYYGTRYATIGTPYDTLGFKYFQTGGPSKDINLPFPKLDEVVCIITDPLIVSRIAVRTEFNLWQTKTICDINHHKEKYHMRGLDDRMHTFSGNKFKHYSIKCGTDFIQFDILTYGISVSCGVISNCKVEQVFHVAASDSIMTKFAELLDNYPSKIYYEKGFNYISSEVPGQFIKIPSFEFYIADGSKKAKPILYLLEQASNIALDCKIYDECAVEYPKCKYSGQLLVKEDINQSNITVKM